MLKLNMPMSGSVEDNVIKISLRTLYAVLISLVLTVTSLVMGYNKIIDGQNQIANQLLINNMELKNSIQDIRKDVDRLTLRVDKMDK